MNTINPNKICDQSSKISKKCLICKGLGIIKTKVQICSSCKKVGDGCYKCKSGMITLPWSECPTCIGLGSI